MSVTVGLDTSTPITAAGIRLADSRTVEVFDVPSEGDRPRHATAAIPLLESLLADAGCGWSDVAKVVVGIGPGGFTGIRVGIATALGIGRGCDAEIVGVNGLSALLAACEPDRYSAALIDARRGELFKAVSSEPDSALCVGRDAAAAGLPAGCVCVGDGALLERERLTMAGLVVPDADSPLHTISAIRLIALENAGNGSSVLEPAYVRAPDAVPTSERQPQ